MIWFQGDVYAAVADCKRRQSVLIVYVKGDDEHSNSMDVVWNHPSVLNIVQRGECVALRLPFTSVEGHQFSQIYPVATVPSTFLIGSNGVQLDLIKGVCSTDELCNRVSAAILTHSSQQRPASPSASGTDLPAGNTQTISQPSNVATTSLTASSTGLVTGAGSPTSSSEDDNPSGRAESLETIADRVKRAQELTKQKQQQKAEEEKEKLRIEEIKRRELGKDLEKLKQLKAEQDAKEIRDELRREKEETRLAREKAKQQITLDREMRHSKYQQELREKEEERSNREKARLAREAEDAARVMAQNSSISRIQFRLPDGSNITHQFEADDLLQKAWNLVSAHDKNPLGNSFRLATIYPRHVFTEEDLTKTLRDLGLVPTATLLVLPPARSGGKMQAQSSSIINQLFSPLWIIWTFIWSFLSGKRTLPADAPTPSSSDKQGSSATSSEGGTTRSQNLGTRPKTSLGQRRVGRLSDLARDDDDQNTWNGNSTQQK